MVLVELDSPVEKFMRRSLYFLDGKDSAAMASRIMKSHAVGSVLVTRDGCLAGIVTERDLVNKVLGEGLDATQVELHSIMSAPVVTVDAKAKDPATHVVWDGNQAWAQITGFQKGWYLSLIARESLGRDKPEAVTRIIEMYGDVEKLIKDNPDLADAIVTTALKLPKGVFKDAAVNGRIELKVRPAWLSPDRDNLWQMFSLAVITGYIAKIPEQNIIYVPKASF